MTVEYLVDKLNDSFDEKLLREWIVEELRKGVCDVVFTKASGEKREMKATLNFAFIPNDLAPQSSNTDSYSEEIVRVFDTEAEAWRSFRLDSVISFEGEKNTQVSETS